MAEQQTKDRIDWIDLAKAIAIILVIMGHINSANGPIKAWIYAFHMPVFFFLTGMVLRQETIDHRYIGKNIRNLLVPYLLWGLIYTELSNQNLIYMAYGSYYTIKKAKTLSSLWFLIVLFVALMFTQGIFHMVCRAPEKLRKCLIGLNILFCLGIAWALPELPKGYPWCMDVAVLATAFILSGHLSKELLRREQTSLQKILFLLLGVGMTQIYRWNPVDGRRQVLMAQRQIGELGFFLGAAIGGCCFICMLAKLICDLNICKRVGTYIGRHTLVLFAVQKPIIAWTGPKVEKLTGAWQLELVITAIVTLCIGCLIAWLVDHFIPCLAGMRTQ